MNREIGQATMEYAIIIAVLSVTMMALVFGVGIDLIQIFAEHAAGLAAELG